MGLTQYLFVQKLCLLRQNTNWTTLLWLNARRFWYFSSLLIVPRTPFTDTISLGIKAATALRILSDFSTNSCEISFLHFFHCCYIFHYCASFRFLRIFTFPLVFPHSYASFLCLIFVLPSLRPLSLLFVPTFTLVSPILHSYSLIFVHFFFTLMSSLKRLFLFLLPSRLGSNFALQQSDWVVYLPENQSPPTPPLL